MNTRTVLIITAVITLSFAFALLLMPTFMATHGMGTSPLEILVPRFFGMT